MKYKTLTLFLFSIAIIGACRNSDSISNELNTESPIAPASSLADTSFQSFVKSVPIIDSNFTLSNKEDFEHIALESNYIPDGAMLIGRLNSIDNYAFIIYSYPADIRLPVLEVYNSEGKKVNEKQLFKYNYCQSALGPENHQVELSADRTKFYLTSSCAIAFSEFESDSIVIQDLIAH